MHSVYIQFIFSIWKGLPVHLPFYCARCFAEGFAYVIVGCIAYKQGYLVGHKAIDETDFVTKDRDMAYSMTIAPAVGALYIW